MKGRCKATGVPQGGDWDVIEPEHGEDSSGDHVASEPALPNCDSFQHLQ